MTGQPPPLPVVFKAERRKTCGSCGADIRKDRAARSTGLCAQCRLSVRQRGRPIVPRIECSCACTRHQLHPCVDDGACGDPVSGVTPCCFDGPDRGDPQFRYLFDDYEDWFHEQAEKEWERIRQEREARWRREGPAEGEIVAEARKLSAEWSPEAAEDIRQLWGDNT